MSKITGLVCRAESIAWRHVRACLDGSLGDPTTAALVTSLIGRDPIADLHEDQWQANEEALDAAYAIGIAVGLLLRPELFTNGDRLADTSDDHEEGGA